MTNETTDHLDDNHHPDPEENARGCYKDGDVVLVKPAGHKWTRTERSSFLIVRMYLSKKEAVELVKPEMTGSDNKVLRKRALKIDMEKLGLPASDADDNERSIKLKKLRGGLVDMVMDKAKIVKEKAKKGR